MSGKSSLGCSGRFDSIRHAVVPDDRCDPQATVRKNSWRAGCCASRCPAPRDLALRKARVCYDHLAGELGPLVHDSLVQRRMLRVGRNGLELTDAGAALLARFVEIGWASRLRRSRVLSFSAAGERALRRQFPIALR